MSRSICPTFTESAVRYGLEDFQVTEAGRQLHKSTGCTRCNADGYAPRVYVAGPMSGLPDLNFPAFHAKAAELRAVGWEVINPAEINDEDPNHVFATHEEYLRHWNKCMRADLTALLTCDAIAMLDGWTRSRGATLEHHVAKTLGLTVFEAGA